MSNFGSSVKAIRKAFTHGEVDGDKMTLQSVDDGKIETMVFTKR